MLNAASSSTPRREAPDTLSISAQVKGPEAESDDELFAMDDVPRAQRVLEDTSRRLAFDEPPSANPAVDRRRPRGRK